MSLLPLYGDTIRRNLNARRPRSDVRVTERVARLVPREGRLVVQERMLWVILMLLRYRVSWSAMVYRISLRMND